jgi:hypothetical protein
VSYGIGRLLEPYTKHIEALNLLQCSDNYRICHNLTHSFNFSNYNKYGFNLIVASIHERLSLIQAIFVVAITRIQN